MPHPHRDLANITLLVLFIAGLILASFLVVQPFLPAILWAVTLVVATWPLMLRVQHFVGDRRGIAVLIMTLLLLLVLVVPLWLAVSTIVGNMDDIAELIQRILTLRAPEPPAWVANVPLIGQQVDQAWHLVTDTGVRELGPKLTPYAGALTRWFASTVGSLAGTFVQFLLTIGIAAVMYASGESGVATAVRFGRRLGGDRGEMAIYLAGQAIRSVALGVVVTAVAQSVVGGIGLAIVGLPFAPVLTAVIFVLCLAQIGPALVLVPAVIWMYYAGDALWGTVLLAFSLVAMTMDNFLRPILIRRGAALPLALILAGVIGGLIAMGLLGIFLGPTVLAIAYTLLNAWMAEDDEADPPTARLP
jgi:predicted PurR-regulated permease PerM